MEVAAWRCSLWLGGRGSMPEWLPWRTGHSWSFRVVWLKMIYKKNVKTCQLNGIGISLTMHNFPSFAVLD